MTARESDRTFDTTSTEDGRKASPPARSLGSSARQHILKVSKACVYVLPKPVILLFFNPLQILPRSGLQRGRGTDGRRDGAQEVHVPEGGLRLGEGAGTGRGADMAERPPGHDAPSGPEGQAAAAIAPKAEQPDQHRVVPGVQTGMGELERIV